MDIDFPIHTIPNNVSKRKIPKIRVVVRKRPLNNKENQQGEEDVVLINKEENTTHVHEPKVRVDMSKYTQIHDFGFDDAYSENDTNLEIYERSVRPLVEIVFEKGMASCFAYGQTGTGKTYTMMGEGSANPGLYRLAAQDIFTRIQTEFNQELSISVSFFEIYGGKLFDLLNNRRRLESREDDRRKVNIVGLSRVACPNIDHLFEVIETGNLIRQTGSTQANINSSRSHAVLQMDIIRQKNKKLFGQFRFIDLAGSERGVDRGNCQRQSRLEGAEINKSLLALKECIRALDQQYGHVPFRGSKLTQVLKDSFMGNCRSVMIANISPSNRSCEHTLNTLRYADRVKELKKGKKKKHHHAYMPHQKIKQRVIIENHHIPLKRNEQKIVKPKKRIKRQNSVKVLPSPRFIPNNNNENINPEKESLRRTHEGVVEKVFQLEDQLVKTHRGHIDVFMTLIKRDMHLLKEFDRMEIQTDDYVKHLEDIIKEKSQSLSKLKKTLDRFRRTLWAEEQVSKQMK